MQVRKHTHPCEHPRVLAHTLTQNRTLAGTYDISLLTHCPCPLPFLFQRQSFSLDQHPPPSPRPPRPLVALVLGDRTTWALALRGLRCMRGITRLPGRRVVSGNISLLFLIERIWGIHLAACWPSGRERVCVPCDWLPVVPIAFHDCFFTRWHACWLVHSRGREVANNLPLVMDFAVWPPRAIRGLNPRPSSQPTKSCVLCPITTFALSLSFNYFLHIDTTHPDVDSWKVRKTKNSKLSARHCLCHLKCVHVPSNATAGDNEAVLPRNSNRNSLEKLLTLRTYMIKKLCSENTRLQDISISKTLCKITCKCKSPGVRLCVRVCAYVWKYTLTRKPQCCVYARKRVFMFVCMRAGAREHECIRQHSMDLQFF